MSAVTTLEKTITSKNDTPCPLSLQKSFQRPQLTFDIVPATPEALAELDAELRNWYSMYLEFRYFKQKVKMYLDSGIFLKGQNVLWHECAESHESEDEEDGRAKVGHEQLVAEEALEGGEERVSLVFRTLSLELL